MPKLVHSACVIVLWGLFILNAAASQGGYTASNNAMKAGLGFDVALSHLTGTEAKALISLMASTEGGRSCGEVTHWMVLGQEDDGMTYVALRCSRLPSDDLVMRVSNDPNGTPLVLPCKQLKSMADVACWGPLE